MEKNRRKNRRKNSKFIELRNRNIIKLFHMIGFNIRLVGNPEFPNFILDEEYKLPISVDGNAIVLRNKFNNSDDDLKIGLGKGKLDSNNIQHIGSKIIKFIFAIEKKAIFKIKLGANLYLHDFKYIGKDKPKYPLFAIYDPKIIYTQEHAEEIIKNLNGEGYQNLCLDTPLFNDLEKA